MLRLPGQSSAVLRISGGALAQQHFKIRILFLSTSKAHEIWMYYQCARLVHAEVLQTGIVSSSLIAFSRTSGMKNGVGLASNC